MKTHESAAIGAVIGLLYGIVLWASYDAFSVASFIIYGDQNYLPLLIAAPIACLSILCVLSYPLWVKHAQNAIVAIATQDYDELEGDEFE
jgi:type III secretory pathway component EscT